MASGNSNGSGHGDSVGCSFEVAGTEIDCVMVVKGSVKMIAIAFIGHLEGRPLDMENQDLRAFILFLIHIIVYIFLISTSALQNKIGSGNRT